MADQGADILKDIEVGRSVTVRFFVGLFAIGSGQRRAFYKT